MRNNELTISWGTLWKVLFMLALGALIFVTKKILLAFLLSIVISSALDPIVSWLSKKGIPRLVGTLIVFIAMGGIIAVVLYAIIPLALLELTNLLENFAEVTGNLLGISAPALDFFGIDGSSIKGLESLVLKGGSSLLGTASSLLGGLALMLAILILSFYLTVGRDGVERFLRSIIPAKYEEGVLNIYDRIRKRIGKWLQIQLFLSLMMGVAVFIGLWILGVKYNLILAVFAAIFELIPIVGPIFAGALAVLVAVSDSFALAIYTLILFLVIQQLESYVIVPVVLKRAVGLHPVVIILSLMLGAEIAGVVGLILAVPAAFLVEEIIDDLASRRKKPSG